MTTDLDISFQQGIDLLQNQQDSSIKISSIPIIPGKMICSFIIK